MATMQLGVAKVDYFPPVGLVVAEEEAAATGCMLVDQELQVRDMLAVMASTTAINMVEEVEEVLVGWEEMQQTVMPVMEEVVFTQVLAVHLFFIHREELVE